MKKLFILASCAAMLLFLSKVNFAQEAAQEPAEEVVVTETEVPAQPHVLPFGYPPYPTVGGNPAYGVPYSYPRAQRRMGGRLFSRQHQPYQLPAPGAVAGAVPPAANPAPPMYHGPVPPLQGTLGVPAPKGSAPATPNVFYRPTPIKNFFSLMTAPRPYIGYDPYAGPVGGMAPAYQPQ